jgi:hypothetical protein
VKHYAPKVIAYQFLDNNLVQCHLSSHASCRKRTFKALRQVIVDDVPGFTLMDPLYIVNEVIGAPHITFVNTHAERDRSANLGTTESNASASTKSKNLRCLHLQYRFRPPPTA